MNEPQNPNKIRRRIILAIIIFLLMGIGIGLKIHLDSVNSLWQVIARIDTATIPVSDNAGLYVDPIQEEFFLAGGQGVTPTSKGPIMSNQLSLFTQSSSKPFKVPLGPPGSGFKVISTKDGVYMTKFIAGPFARLPSHDLWLWDGNTWKMVANSNYANVGGAHYFAHNEELYRLLPSTGNVRKYVSVRPKASLQKFAPNKGAWSDVATTGLGNLPMTYIFVSGPDYLLAFEIKDRAIILHHIDIRQLPKMNVKKMDTQLTASSSIRHVLAANKKAVYFFMLNDTEGVYRLDLATGVVTRREDLDPPFHPYSTLSIYQDPNSPGTSYLYLSKEFFPSLKFQPRMPMVREGGRTVDRGELYRFEAPLD